MKFRPSLLPAILAVTLVSHKALGATIIYSSVGGFHHLGSKGPDALGLASASYQLEVSHDALATPTSSSGSAESGSSQYTSSIATLTLTGSLLADGVYTAACTTSVWNNSSNTDIIELKLQNVQLPSSIWGTFMFHFDLPISTYTGSPPIPLPTFSESDVLATGGIVWLYNGDGNQVDQYQVRPTRASGELANDVPEPTSATLWLGLGVMGLVAARRRRKTA